jgi:alpha-galactosidase/6-phospho-beta-glucosidase family protein
MKAVFIGGGALRLLGILRGALAEKRVFQNGEINLYDLDQARAEAMGRMILKTPEFAGTNCKITWGTSLSRALDGADVVGVILMPGSQRTFELGNEACLRHGFIPSDNVSPNGAFLAIKGSAILLNIARQMKKYCPSAWLLDFANPVAVFSGMLNNHTSIKTLGVCAGYTNHQWDLSRLFGKDEQRTDFNVDAVGVNHLSFIVRGTAGGKDLFEQLRRRLTNRWKMPPLLPTWPAAFHRAIPAGIARLIRFFRNLGVIIFSSEGDGMMHLHYDEALKKRLREFKPQGRRGIERLLQNRRAGRERADVHFRSFLSKDLPGKFWKDGWREPENAWAQRQDHDIFVEVLRGISGAKRVKVVTSRLNAGAVDGYSDRSVLEYSQIISNGEIRPAGILHVPGVVQGLIGNLSSHQTLMGDALATEDPRLLAHALLSYPVNAFSKAARTLFKELAGINQTEMPRLLRSVGDFL